MRNDIGLIYLVMNKMNLGRFHDEILDLGFIALARGYKAYDESKGALSTFLCVCIRSEFLRWLDTKKKKEEIGSEVSLNQEVTDNIEMENLILATEGYPHFELMRQELLDCIKKLPERKRNLIWQFYFEGVFVETLAESKKVTRMAIYDEIKRTRERLKRMLQERGIYSSQDFLKENNLR